MSDLDREGLSADYDYPADSRRAAIETPDGELWAFEIAMQQAARLRKTAEPQPQQIIETQE